MVSPFCLISCLIREIALGRSLVCPDGASAHMGATGLAAGGRKVGIVRGSDSAGYPSGVAGSIGGHADGWLPRVQQDFMSEALPPCYERHRISRGSAAVKTQRPIISDDEHVVLKFRPRTS